MNEIQKQIYFETSPEKVWALLMDVASTPKWVSGVLESQILKPGTGAGLAWQEVWEFLNQKIQVGHEIKKCTPLETCVIESSLPLGASMTKTISLKPHAAGAELKIDLTWDLGMASMMIAEDAAREVMDNHLSKTCENWKRLVEAK